MKCCVNCNRALKMCVNHHLYVNICKHGTDVESAALPPRMEAVWGQSRSGCADEDKEIPSLA
jgi:hypothetical protein